MRGEAFTNKIMAKKSNFRKFNERMQKKMQIEATINRDQVNSFGGLGRVGLDYEGHAPKLDANGNPIAEQLVPGFSSSALKYVKLSQTKNQLSSNNSSAQKLRSDIKNFIESEEEKEENLLEGSEDEINN